MEEERIVAGEIAPGEEDAEATLRPKRLSEYIGQKSVTNNLKVFIDCPEGRKIMDQNQSSYGSLLFSGAGSAFFSGAGAASFSAADFRA